MDAFSIAHPSSLPLAMALGSAVADGRLQPLPDVPAQIALMRASRVMRSATGRLDPAAAGLPPVAVVRVEGATKTNGMVQRNRPRPGERRHPSASGSEDR